MIKKYAELLVKKGVNLVEGQELVVEASIEHVELVRAICEEAFKAGAKDVVVHYRDEVISKLKYENCDVEHFHNVPKYLSEFRNEYALKNAAIIMLTGDDPENLKGIDAAKIQAWSKAYRTACKPFYDRLDLGVNRWCIAGAPTLAWANKVFPEQSNKEAIESLWNTIFKTVYLNDKDPLKRWEKHRISFEARVNALNTMKIKSLHLTNSLGTDLTIELNKDYLFAGGGSYTTDGVYSFPNMPTEEIFTSPYKYGVNGKVYSSLPLNYNGNIIDEFCLTFKDGRVIDYSAKKGEDLLGTMIETDEGSHYLGEVALIPYDSPISKLNLLFFNTLYDENASCHLAVGKGFGECIKDGLSMDKEQLLEKGINNSLTHVDFMIGTKDLNIDAILENGDKIAIFNEGNWAFSIDN